MKVTYVIWNDDRRAWLAAEGTGLFYTVNPDRVRQFDTQEEASRANYHYDKIADEYWELKNKSK